MHTKILYGANMFKALIGKSVFAIALIAGAAQAAPQIQKILIGSEQVEFPLAEGYCIINGRDPAETKFRDAVIEGMQEMEVQLVFAECLELRDWRIGRRKTVNHFGYVGTALPEEGTSVSRENYLLNYGSDLKKITSPTEDNGAMIEDVVRQPQIGKTKLVGEIERNQDAVYVAMVQGAVDNTAHTMTRAGVFSSTLINGAKVNQYIFMPYTGGSTYTYLLGSLKAHANAVQSLNKR